MSAKLMLILLPLMVTSQVMDDSYPPKDEILNYGSLDKPFRIQKVNLLWEKARKKLAEGKLKLLYSELKLQDKEELTLKKLKAESGDKDGMREAEVRKRFNGIMNKFGLSKIRSSDEEKSAPKDKMAFFKDKRLNKLWEKAEKSGLTDDELMALKLEFKHHQEKVDEYNDLLEVAAKMEEENDRSKNREENHLHFEALEEDEDESGKKHHKNELDGKAKEVKRNYDRLHRLATNAHAKEFQDDKVQVLWDLALDGDFTDEELESLRTELHHFETRLHKLTHLQAELNLVDERGNLSDGEDLTEGRKIMDKKLKKHLHTVQEMEKHLKMKIATRHTEL